jgi:peptidoglycan/LPS O-acetylase OafA/YrhL
VAVLVVVVSHFGLGNIVPGRTGVTMFFVISGFVIMLSLLREEDATGRFSARNFYVKRAFKILPPLFVAVLLPTVLFARYLVLDWHKVLGQVGFYFNWYYAINDGKGVLPGSEVTWSLSIEEQFYVVFALIWALVIWLVPLPYRRRGVAVLCFAAVSFSLVQRAALHNAGSLDIRLLYGTDTRIDSIAVGVLTAIWWNAKGVNIQTGTGNRSRLRGIGLLGIAAVLFLCSVVMRMALYKDVVRPLSESIATALLIILGLLYGEALASRQSLVSRLISCPPVQLVGRASYSIYLVHLPLLLILQMYLQAVNHFIAIPLEFMVSIAAGCLIYWIIEIPALRMRKTLLARKIREQADYYPLILSNLGLIGVLVLRLPLGRSLSRSFRSRPHQLFA